MPKQQPLFQELINILEPIITTNDIKRNTFDEMINATLVLGIMIGANDGLDTKAALLTMKTTIAKHIDAIITDMG
jgi:hypothetical protein